MNTVKLTGVIKRKIMKGTNFMGVLACDQLPKHVDRCPAVLIVKDKQITLFHLDVRFI